MTPPGGPCGAGVKVARPGFETTDVSLIPLLDRLPRGASLTEESWRSRHRILTRWFWAQLPLLALLGLAGSRPVAEIALFVVLLAALGAAAGPWLDRTWRARLMSLALIGTSFAAIELGDGSVHR